MIKKPNFDRNINNQCSTDNMLDRKTETNPSSWN